MGAGYVKDDAGKVVVEEDKLFEVYICIFYFVEKQEHCNTSIGKINCSYNKT